jgi:cytoskeletal protein CcmA (bactofilin family)
MTNKKFLFIGMAVLLSASLFFLGCPTDGDDDDPPPVPDTTPNWYDGLGDGLTETDNTVTLTADTTLSANLTVPADKTLKIGTGAKLTVPVDITVTLTGTGALVGTGVTSKLELGTGVTVGGLTAGTYVWYNAGWFDETVYNAAVTAATELVTALTADKAAVDVADATKVNLTDDAEVPGTSGTPTPVPVNVTLATGAHTLTVANGKGLSVAGTVTVAGTFDVAGTLHVTGNVEVQSGGEYQFLSTGSGTISGNITIESGGAVVSVGGGDLSGAGWTVVQQGGRAYLDVNKTQMFVGTASDNAAMIKLASGTVSTNNSGYKLEGTATLGTTFPVASTKTLSVAGGAILNVAEASGVLNVAGTLDVAGTLNVAGTVNVNNGGKYVFQATGRGTSTGTINIVSGGEVLSVPGSDMAGTGYTVVEFGGKAYSGADWDNKRTFVGGSGDSPLPIIALTSGSVSTNNHGYELDGAATMYGTPASNSQGNFTVGETGNASDSAHKNGRLVLKAGSVLTVPGDDLATNKHILLVVTNNTGNLPGVTGEPIDGEKGAAQIVLQEHGYLDLYLTDTSGLGPGDYSGNTGSLPHNFYDSGSNKITTNNLKNRTFTWDVAAGGASTPGWKSN